MQIEEIVCGSTKKSFKHFFVAFIVSSFSFSGGFLSQNKNEMIVFEANKAAVLNGMTQKRDFEASETVNASRQIFSKPKISGKLLASQFLMLIFISLIFHSKLF